MTSALLKTTVKGHVLIQDGMVLKNGILVPDENTGRVRLDKFNAVHNQNMAAMIARGLSNTDADAIGTHQIYGIGLGNGGSSVDSMSQITYLPPNVTGSGARLYNQTYFEVVDEQQSGTPAANSVTFQQSTTDNTSIVIVTCTIAAGEPSGQDLTDTPPDPNFNSEYSFDELGLLSYGSAGTFDYTTVPTDSLLMTHIIFSPILKTANRELVITYTLTVSVS
jgi:hypothetical protein